MVPTTCILDQTVKLLSFKHIADLVVNCTGVLSSWKSLIHCLNHVLYCPVSMNEKFFGPCSLPHNCAALLCVVEGGSQLCRDSEVPPAQGFRQKSDLWPWPPAAAARQEMKLNSFLRCSRKAEMLSSNKERRLPLASQAPGSVIKSQIGNPASAKAVISVTSFTNKALVPDLSSK